jgi:hypothetical protein
MNEQLKELAKHAGIIFESSKQNRVHSVSTETLEKFAELIVQECAELFPHTFTDEQYQRRIDKTIKKHFGVQQ